MHKIRIVFFFDILKEDQDGVSNTCHQLLQHIPLDRFDPIVITPHPPVKTDYDFPIITCPYIRVPFYREYRIAFPQVMRSLSLTLDQFDPHIVHWSSPSPQGLFAIHFAKNRKLPVVTIYHTHFNAYLDTYIKRIPGIRSLTTLLFRPMLKMYRKCELVLAPSRDIRDFLQFEAGVDSENIEIWGRGVDAEKFHPKHRVEGLFDNTLPPERKTVLFVSRLVKIKDTTTLIRLYQLIEPKHNLVIVGDGPDRRRMEKAMPNAIFTGHLTGNPLSQAFASADVFVFTSTTETFGNVVLEAMASGLPIVAANAGGPRDMVRNGKNGFLVEPGNAEAFAAKINLLLKDSELYNQLSRNALFHARGQNWKNICARLFSTYEEVLQNHQKTSLK